MQLAAGTDRAGSWRPHRSIPVSGRARSRASVRECRPPRKGRTAGTCVERRPASDHASRVAPLATSHRAKAASASPKKRSPSPAMRSLYQAAASVISAEAASGRLVDPSSIPGASTETPATVGGFVFCACGGPWPRLRFWPRFGDPRSAASRGQEHETALSSGP